MMNKLVLIFLFITLVSCAATSDQKKREREILLQPDRLTELDTDDLNSYPEIYLKNESALQEIDSDLGVVQDAYFTGTDNTKLSFSLNFSQDFEDPSKVQTVDFIYNKRLRGNYQEFWWGVQFKRTVAKYNAIANESGSNPGAVPRADSEQSFSIFGLGIGHRFRALGREFLSDRFFEMINVYGNYVFHLDNGEDEKYQGFGYTAEYSLQYRSSEQLFYGTKLSYNWALVERDDPEDDTSLAQNSLVFGWFTLGFELGYYF